PHWPHAARRRDRGVFTLGLCGRLAMYCFAQFTDRPNIVTLRGVLSVGIAGSIAGIVAAVLYVSVGRWIIPRAPTLVRGIAFGLLTLLVASPGIRPPWPLTFALFTPAFLLYGVIFVALREKIVSS
ncbi:MAG: hypothetical protein ABI556_06735, partial [Gemmatimonadales bacterium]